MTPSTTLVMSLILIIANYDTFGGGLQSLLNRKTEAL